MAIKRVNIVIRFMNTIPSGDHKYWINALMCPFICHWAGHMRRP